MRRAALIAALLLARPALAQDVVGAAISCILRPVNEIAVAPPVAGILETIAVDRGDSVTEGQVLATLVSRVEQAQLSVARQRAQSRATLEARMAQLADAERRLEQAQALSKRGVGAKNQADEAAMEADVARALVAEAEDLRLAADLEVAAAEAVVDLRTIRAPVSGVVLVRHADPGEYAAVERPLLEIVTVDALLAEVLMPAEAYGRITRGQRASITTEGAPDPHPATVDAIDPVVNAASRSFGLRLRIDNAEGRLTAGNRCSVTF